MPRTIPGLHHVTAISGPPQANVDFYAGLLKQRLVKRTVNFDDPGTYHLYYGNQTGAPGTILTFFPFADAGPGRAGPGMASAYAYAVPKGGFDEWMLRLAEEVVDFAGPVDRFGQRVITLSDPDGAPVELVETDRESGDALDGFHSVTLWERDPGPTARLLTDIFGYEQVGHEAADGVERLRLAAPGDARGAVVDLIRSDAPSIGRQGTGTIHHVAFRAEDDACRPSGARNWPLPVTGSRRCSTGSISTPSTSANPVVFCSRSPPDPPGFAVDEDAAHLGEALKLPAKYEALRDRIEAVLPPLKVA